MSLAKCCITGFQWDGQPQGHEDTLAGLPCYIAGDGDGVQAALLYVADALGWTFPNARLMADQLARETGVAVYVPDFFGGEVLDADKALQGQWEEVDMAGFLQRNRRSVREPEVFACARALREKYERVGAIGFCYGGWAALRLGGTKSEKRYLVDVISVGHPSLVTLEDIDGVAVPLQVLAPEHDPVYTAELKRHTMESVPRRGIALDYQHFPGVTHGALVRGWPQVPGERAAMVRALTAAVAWFKTFLVE